MEQAHKYKFSCGFETIEEGEATFLYLRRRNDELAAIYGKPVTMHVYNEFVPRWERLGTSYPDGKHVNSFGDICILEPDGRNYKHLGKA